MKYKLLILLFSIIYKITFAQDILKKQNGETIFVLIHEVNKSEIKYKNYDDKHGDLIVLSTSLVKYIKYENGDKEYFNNTDNQQNDTIKTTQTIVNITNKELYIKGGLDATTNYHCYKNAAGGTLVLSLISPLVGLIPAIICSNTKPRFDNLTIPDNTLAHDQVYLDGYVHQAKSIKSGKVWKNWGIAVAINVATTLILFSK